MRILTRRMRARGGTLPWRESSVRLRSQLDTERVIHATVEEVQRALRPVRTELWMTRGRDDPVRASAAGRLAVSAPDEGTERIVRKAARRARTIAVAGRHTAPIVAPQSGLVGVLHVVDPELDAASRVFIDEIAREAGFALETANLYEQAVAGKEKSDAILGKVADAIVVTDITGRVVQWNERAAWYFERPAPQAIGRVCTEVLALSGPDGPLDCSGGCALALAFAGADGPLGIELTRSRADGRTQPLLASVSEVTDADGVAYEVVHSLRDITRLREADEAKTMFLATASHELKTPLTVIQGFAQLLADPGRVTPEDQAEALRAIRRRAVQLDGIIERLLLSSRIEAGRAEVEVRPIDIAPIVAEEVEALTRATGRPVSLSLPPELPETLADPRGMLTVAQHLLENALKYSPVDSVVSVEVQATSEHVTVTVTDHGIGMDAEQAARCFEKFWQAESSDVRRYGGTGIGLYIVRALVVAMGGEVGVESSPGNGSTFTVTLRPADAGAQPSAPSLDRHPVPAEPSVIREFMRQMGIPTRR